MRIKLIVFIFFIKILHIYSNVLYISQSLLFEDNLINYNWLKSAINSNKILVISEVKRIEEKDKKINTFTENKEIQDPKFPENHTKKIIKTEFFNTEVICKNSEDLVKVDIDDINKIDEIINNVKNELKANKYKKIEKISTIITKYESEETKKKTYEYKVFKGIKDEGFNIIYSNYNEENNNDNPSVISITYNKNFLIKHFFFSYFQVEDNFGIFEDSKINVFILENLKKTNLKSNNLFKNCKNLKTIKLGLGYTDDINIIENKDMLLNCENLEDFYLNNFDNKKISFENLKKLLALNVGKIREINEKKISYNNTSILDEKKFYNCEMLRFNLFNFNLVINKDTIGLDDVFFNCGKNIKDKNHVKITIEEDTILDEINLDTMFNNSYFTSIEIINNSDKKIVCTEKIFENGKLINLIIQEKNKEKKLFNVNFLEYKNIEGLNIKDFLENEEKFNNKLEEKATEIRNKKTKEQQENDSKSINNENSKCCLCCLKLYKNCKCC